MSDASAIRQLMSTLIPGDLSELITIFSYQGFNPEMVMQHLAQIKTENQISDQEFHKDMEVLLCLAAISGNYTPKNKEKRDEKGTAKADALFARYKLKTGSVGTEKKAVTLPRVVLTFPIGSSRVSLDCPEKNFVGPFTSTSLPHVMKTPVFPALIPSDFGEQSKRALLIAFCCYTCDQAKSINEELKKSDPAEVFRKQWEYVEIGHKSPEPQEKERKLYFSSSVVPLLEQGWPGIVEVLRQYKQKVNSRYDIPEKFGRISTPKEKSTSETEFE